MLLIRDGGAKPLMDRKVVEVSSLSLSFFVSLSLTRCTIPCACHAKRNLNVQKWSNPLAFLTCCLGNVLRATAAWTFSTSQLSKMVRSWVFCTFSLRNVLRATTACTFAISQLPNVVPTPSVFNILTWKRASPHNVHFFDISSAKSGPHP